MKLLEYILLAVVLCAMACANPVAPTGGPKDVTPPALDTAESTQTLQTSYEKQTIVLSFDEYVQLEEPNRNVVVSPPLEYPLDFTIRGASVEIEFHDEEVLRPNTTYTINLSNAVKDLNEGNPAANLRFVFSTGSYIDSLEMNATVRDAVTGEPVKDVNVLLYDRMEDSIIYKEKPYYFAQTAAGGIASLQNLSEGDYKVVALEDANRNLIYDLPEERLGFVEDAIRVDSAEDRDELEILISKEDAPLIVTAVNKNFRGSATIGFNRPPGSMEIRGMDVEPDHTVYDDSLYLWWSSTGMDSVTFSLFTESFSDTMTFPDLDTMRYPPLRLRRSTNAPSPPNKLYWNQPIDTVNRALIVHNDSLPATASWKIEIGSSPDQLIFSPKREYPPGDTIILLPGAIRGRYGSLTDTMSLYWDFMSPDELANLFIQIDSLDPGGHYITRLVEEDDRTKEIERAYWTGKTQYQWDVRGLIPRSMVIELIRDRNQNKQWDPVRYLKGKQPEPIYRKSITNLRANWDVELTLDEPL